MRDICSLIDLVKAHRREPCQHVGADLAKIRLRTSFDFQPLLSLCSSPTAARSQVPSRSAYEEVFQDIAALACMQRTAALSTGQAPFGRSRLYCDAHDLVFGLAGGTGVGLWFVHGALLIRAIAESVA
jgi:hypothetical protein